eukprot:530080_1
MSEKEIKKYNLLKTKLISSTVEWICYPNTIFKCKKYFNNQGLVPLKLQSEKDKSRLYKLKEIQKFEKEILLKKMNTANAFIKPRNTTLNRYHGLCLSQEKETEFESDSETEKQTKKRRRRKKKRKERSSPPKKKRRLSNKNSDKQEISDTEDNDTIDVNM